jgi:hypothetical protein
MVPKFVEMVAQCLSSICWLMCLLECPRSRVIVSISAEYIRILNFLAFHTSPPAKGFVVENRTLIGKPQDFKAVETYVLDFSTNQFLELASNFHFLLYLLTNDVLKFEEGEIQNLCQIVVNRDRTAAIEWAENNDNWSTFMMLVNANRGM